MEAIKFDSLELVLVFKREEGILKFYEGVPSQNFYYEWKVRKEELRKKGFRLYMDTNGEWIVSYAKDMRNEIN